MNSKISSLFVVIVLSACAVAPVTTTLNAPFDESQFSWVSKIGTSSITGQAFLKTRGGDVKLGAGNIVKLLPVNPYTTEMRQRFTINRENGSNIVINKTIEKYTISTVADANGNFEFKNLSAGSYYVSCAIIWEVPSQYGLQKSGGVAYATVTVAEGEAKKIILTRN